MFELVLRAPEAVAEPLSDALLDDLGALAVTVEDADAGAAGERALYGEPGLPAPAAAWQRSTLKALFDGDDAAERAATLVLAQPWAAEVHVQSLAPVPDADWVRLTQAQFPPTQVGARLWIVPTWHEPPDATALNIRIDPGVAFGTGTHPTTRLCLAWLEEQLAARARVLDYGCGSGILAIAAARLRAAQVHGVDIDEQAVRAAQHNSAANGVDPQSARYTASADLAPLDTPGGRFDVVLANILANPLKLLAPALLARVAPGGSLVLAGLLNRQAEELIALYRSIDEAVELSVWREMDGWSCLAGRRRSG